MSIFKKKPKLSEEEMKWNLIWDMWTEGAAVSPYAELMSYESEVNNGGHDQYFLNTGNTGDLQKELSILYGILPANLKDNLQKAHDAYLVLEENEDDEESEALLETCDDVFYENEQLVIDILKAYADTLPL